MNIGKILRVESIKVIGLPPGEYAGHWSGYKITILPIEGEGSFILTTQQGIRGLERVKVSVSESGEITINPTED